MFYHCRLAAEHSHAMLTPGGAVEQTAGEKALGCRTAPTHPSFSNSPRQSTTGPPLPILSRVWRLTENTKQKKRFKRTWGNTKASRTQERSRLTKFHVPTIWPRTASLSEVFSLHKSNRWSVPGITNTNHIQDAAKWKIKQKAQDLVVWFAAHSQPVSLSLLMALDRSLTQPRKPAPCFLWIFLWFQTLMVIESVFPMYLKAHGRKKISYRSQSTVSCFWHRMKYLFCI